MKEQDRARFRANIQWFNQFFEGMRKIYEIVQDQLPVEFFPGASAFSSDNFYYPRQKVTPSIPPYYALLLEGFHYGLQVLTVVDSRLIAVDGFFVREPSIIIVLHNHPDKNSWVDELALNVIRNNKIVGVRNVNGIIWGCIESKYPTDFFAYQVGLDKFSDIDDLQKAVQQHILNPMIENLQKGIPGLSP